MAAANTVSNVTNGYARKKGSGKYGLVTNKGKGFSKAEMEKISAKEMKAKWNKSTFKITSAGSAAKPAASSAAPTASSTAPAAAGAAKPKKSKKTKKPKKPKTFMEKIQGSFSGTAEKWGGHIKGVEEVFGALGVAEKLKSFGDSTVAAAADLESSKIGFDFVMSKLKSQAGGGKGKGKKGPANAKDLEKSFADYWTALRDNAQSTAFSADHVLEGGMAAIKLTKGDTGKAMQLVKLAEDMAAFNPGKSVAEAMEAIEAANSKDYKKLEDFGFEFKKGSWDKFLKDAGDWFQGGGKKLNTSANGMWEIISEGVKGSLQNAGVAALEQVKPIMLRLVNWLNSGGFKKLENIAAKTVDVFVKCFLWMMDVIGPVFGWLEKALDWVGANFETLKPILNGLIAAFAAFAVISTVVSIISGIGAVIGLLGNPIFWIVAAIGLLTAAWTGNWFGIQDKTKAAVAWIVSSYQSLAQEIKWFVDDTKQFFTDLGGWITQIWNGIVTVTTTLARQLWQEISAAFQYVWSIVTTVMTRIFTFHKLIWDGIVQIVTATGSFIANTVKSAFNTVSGIVNAAFDTIVGIGRAGMEMLRGIFKGVWQGAAGDHMGAIKTIKEAVMGMIGKVGALLSGFASKAMNYALSFVIGYVSGLAGLFQSVRDAVMPVWNFITATWDELSAFVVTTAGQIRDRVKAAWGEFENFMKDLAKVIDDGFQTAFAAARKAVHAGIDYIEIKLKAMKSYISDVLSKIGDFFVTTWDTVSSAAITAFNTMYDWVAGKLKAVLGVATKVLSGFNEFTSLVWGIIVGTFFWGVRIIYDVMNVFLQQAQKVWNVYKNMVSSIFATVGKIVQTAIAFAVSSFQSFVNFMQKLGPAIVGYVTGVFRTVFTAASNAIYTAIGYIRTGLGAIWSYVTSAMSAISSFFISTWNTVSSAAISAFTSMYAWVASTLNAISGVVTSVLTGISSYISLAWNMISGTFTSGVNMIYNVMTGFVSQAMSFGSQFMNGLIQGFQSMWGPLVQQVQQIWNSIKNIFGSMSATVNVNAQPVNGSHKTGLNRVPFNGYIAELHQGEMVLTSEQANQYRSGQLSSTQRSSMLQPYTGAGSSSTVDQSKTVAIANLVGEMHIHDEADENRFIDKLKRMLEEDLLTEGEGVYVG
ncbi:MAG: hypothetical protein ACQEXQ_22105 [Bacillota bacterium]